MRRVEWGSTIFEEFTCKEKTTDSDVNIVPTSAAAFLETYVEKPVVVQSLPAVVISDGIYVISFYAEKSKFLPKQTYYISFYWEYDSYKMCERVPVLIKSEV